MDLAEIIPAAEPAFVITAETDADITAREALLDRAMGPGRKRKSSEKLRRGRRPSEGLAFVARDASGALVGTVRLWDVAVKSPSPLWGGVRGGGTPSREVTRESLSWPQYRENEKGSAPPPLTLPGRATGLARPSDPHKGEGDLRALLLGPLAVDPALKNAGLGSALMRHAIAEATRLGHAAILLVGDAPYYARFGFSADRTGALAMPGPYERHRFLALELRPGALDGARGVLKAAGRRTAPVTPAVTNAA